MDAQTLHAHRQLWGSEDIDKRYTGHLTRLTPAEQQLFLELWDNYHGQRVRMEQERVGYTWAADAIRET